jgi:hypothetical protein
MEDLISGICKSEVIEELRMNYVQMGNETALDFIEEVNTKAVHIKTIQIKGNKFSSVISARIDKSLIFQKD